MTDNPTIAGRPLPLPTEVSAPHWQGAKEGRLMVQRCKACGKYIFIPRHACTNCLADALEWTESVGVGQIYSFTIVHRPPHPTFEPPYCIAIIALAEGWHMTSNIVETPLDKVRVGATVRVLFRQIEHMALPFFIVTELEAVTS